MDTADLPVQPATALEVGALVEYRGRQTDRHGLIFRITAVDMGRYQITHDGRSLVFVNVHANALTPVPAAVPTAPRGELNG